MDSKFHSAKKEVLVEIVKLAQKQQMKGSKGGWKEFLKSYDKKLGDSLSDPSKRSIDVLVAFLKTFNQDDLKIFDKVLQCHSNRDAVEHIHKSSPDSESIEQRLVRLTFEHPLYPMEYSFPSHEEDWLVTKRSKKSNFTHSKAMLAIDCEMVLCQDGTDALVRICAVDRNLEVKLNKFVKPDRPIADYRTEITGIMAEDLDGVSCSLSDVQMSMKKLLSHGTILIGHSLHNDLRALKIDHARVIDTSYIFKNEDEPSNKRPSLYNLCKFLLGFELRKKGSPHNCLDDACTAMKLVLAKIERGVDSNVPLICEKVQEREAAKLLVHRIPVTVHSEELHKVILGDFTIEVKANKKRKGDKYSAFVNFKNEQEANEAFEKLEGTPEKDRSGLPQKLVSFHLDSGISGDLCVRKMPVDNSSKEVTPKIKRPLEGEETLAEPKKQKTEDQCTELKEASSADCNQCETHLKEIERLKKELSQRDREISDMNKLVVNLVRKQGF